MQIISEPEIVNIESTDKTGGGRIVKENFIFCFQINMYTHWSKSRNTSYSTKSCGSDPELLFPLSLFMEIRILDPWISPFPLSFKILPTSFLSSLLPNKKDASGFICRKKERIILYAFPKTQRKPTYSTLSWSLKINLNFILKGHRVAT